MKNKESLADSLREWCAEHKLLLRELRILAEHFIA